MTPILYESSEVDFQNNGLGLLAEIYNVDVTEQRNGIFELAASYPVNGKKYNDIQVGRIILAKPSPSDPEHAFRIASIDLDISNNNIEISANSITYDLKNNLIKSVDIKEANGLEAMHALQNAMVHKSIFEFYSNIQTRSSTKLSYVNPLEAVAGTQGSILQYWGGEMVRQNRRIAMYSRRGKDNVMTFRLGKNINSLKYTTDTSNLVTKIYPYVKKTTNEVDRLIEGTPVESKNMKNYFDMYIQGIDVSQNITIGQDDTDAQIKTKINAYAKNWFTQSAHTDVDLPDITVDVDVISLRDSAEFNDKFKELETIGLTDTVTVFVPEFNVDVTAVVNELHYDPIAEQVTKLTIGTAKMSYTDYTHDQFDDMQNKIEDINEEATYAAAKLWDTETELDFSTDGIVATDKIDPNALVIFNSAGLGVSQDGGRTFGNAITGRGINATAITTGILKAINIEGVNIKGSKIEGTDIDVDKTLTIATGGKITWNSDSSYFSFSADKKYWGGTPGGTAIIPIKESGTVTMNTSGNITMMGDLIAPDSSGPGYMWYHTDLGGVGSNKAYGRTIISEAGIQSAIFSSKSQIAKTVSNYLIMTPNVLAMGTNIDKPTVGLYSDTGFVQAKRFEFSNDPSDATKSLQLAFYQMSGTTPARFVIVDYANNPPKTSASANAVISSSGALFTSSSARRYKTDIQYTNDVDLGYSLMYMKPTSWLDKQELATEQAYWDGADDEDVVPKRYVGLIAENLLQAGLSEYVDVDSKTGQVQSIYYDRLVVALLPALADMNRRLVEQEAKNE